MISRIGVAVDGGPATEVAVAHAGLLAERLHARLIPFGVVEPRPYAVGWGSVAVPVEDPTSTRRRRNGALAEAPAHGERLTVSSRVRGLRGPRAGP